MYIILISSIFNQRTLFESALYLISVYSLDQLYIQSVHDQCLYLIEYLLAFGLRAVFIHFYIIIIRNYVVYIIIPSDYMLYIVIIINDLF